MARPIPLDTPLLRGALWAIGRGAGGECRSCESPLQTRLSARFSRATGSISIRSSRIVDTLLPGASVVTTRGHVQYVVTEYGVVNLRGMSLRQRADALIQLAHPDFRADLRAAAVERRLFAVSE